MKNGSQAQVTVAQLMTPDPIVVDESATVYDAVRLLEENDISGMPVIDREGFLVGVISQTDIVRARAVDHLWERWPGLRVRHLMHSPAMTADAGMSLEDAAQAMERAHIHRLIVVDDDQLTPVGVISTTDLVRALAHRPTDG
ncbi:MAG TPA: CBS domain-containing protein [Candidatus Limnocylindrales bacterium]|jgi:CBS domain-containing protein